MDWPFSSPPSENEILKVCFGSTIEISGWEVDSYVIFRPALNDVDALIVGIDSTFQDLYGLGADYQLSYRIEGAG